MTTATNEDGKTKTRWLWDSTWSTRVVVSSIVLVLLYRIALEIYSRRLEPLGSSVIWFFVCLLPLFLLAAIPMLTRRTAPETGSRLSWAGVFKEVSLAIPLSFVALVATGIYVQIVARIVPKAQFGTHNVEQLSRYPTGFALFSFLVLMVVIGPICEEVFYRGFLYNVFRRRLPIVLAVLAQAVLFGVSHPYPLAGSISVGIFGVFAAAAYHWRRKILTPILMHMALNGVSAAGILIAAQTSANSAVIGIAPDRYAEGCVIASVGEVTPAQHAGLKTGDRIVQLGDYSIVNQEHLYRAVRLYKPGDTIAVIYVRDDRHWQIDVELISRQEWMSRSATSSTFSEDSLKPVP